MPPARSHTSIEKYASSVSIFVEFLPRYKEYLHQCIRHFKAGCLCNIFVLGKRLLQIKWYYQTIQKMKLEFEESTLQVGSSEFKIPKNQSLIKRR